MIASSTRVQEPTLAIGAQGDDVRFLQSYINYRFEQLSLLSGTQIRVDGYFGPKTRNAAKYLQCIGGLRVDGRVGPQTWRFIKDGYAGLPVLRRGSQGSGVHAVQLMLKRLQFSELITDGVFGEQTERALKTMQQRFGLVPDGIVGPNTWKPIAEARFFSQPCAAYVEHIDFQNVSEE
ncbi:MAG: peptidoglycan-binding protein [Cyanobacteria bacterium J06648_16]